MKATVTDVETVGANTYVFRFETPEGFSAEPGQFVKLGTEIDGESEARFYTLSSPSTVDTFEVTIEIDLEAGGPFSEFLAGVEPGVEMELSGPFGRSHYEDEPRVVILAGGPGIGPAVAIAERAVQEGNEAAIVYAADGEPAHRERLDALREAGSSVAIVDAEDIETAVEDVVTGGDGEQLFVYGFGAFVSAAETAIEAAGSDPDDAKVENFG